MTAELRLPARLDTAAAPGLRASLADHAGQPISLEASQVELLGGLCLETILIAKNRWEKEDIPFAMEKPSDAIRADLRTFGLTENDINGGGAE